MNRDYGKEIDRINEQLIEIKQLLTETHKKSNVKRLKKQQARASLSSDKRLLELMDELCAAAQEQGNTGFVTYLGVYAAGERQSNWLRSQVNTDELLALIESNAATKVLHCVGSSDRLNLLLALLRAPKTVAQLVEECGYNTTGQVYHHLKPLLAADLAREDEKKRGYYVVVPHRVQGIIMLLAGVSDMLDTHYTQGNWESQA